LASGKLSLGGTLAVSLINSFAPVAGNSFDLFDWGTLAGTFTSLQLPPLAGGLVWDASQLYTTGLLSVVAAPLPGDFNHNGAVDAADYAVWRDTLGQSGAGLAADGNANGIVDSGDYDLWRSHFGQTLGSGSVSSTSSPVIAAPEPPTAALIVAGVIGIALSQP